MDINVSHSHIEQISSGELENVQITRSAIIWNV